MRVDTSVDAGGSVIKPWIVILIFVVLPIILNAIALFPDVEYATPGDNDQIFHYVFIERANQAIAAGDNPFDHWVPELELGFPQFLYYQNLPHLTVVAFYRLMFEQISLLRLLNLVRYLLMVLFPLTVYWSMRKMEFSLIAAAVGAAFSSTLSSRFDLGFDFHSYVWAGYAMFPQLCSMHFMFIATACLWNVLDRSKGFAAAIIASSAVVLCDLIYGYIFAVMALILWLLATLKQAASAHGWRDGLGRLSRLNARFAIVALSAAAITAYQTVPFLHQVQYINQGFPLLPGNLIRHWWRASGGPANLFVGSIFDNNRLPVVTTLVFLGIIYGAIGRRPEAKLGLAVVVTYALLIFGRLAFGWLIGVLPLAHLVPFSRLSAGVDFGAILLAGLGGELIWKCQRSNWPRLLNLAPVVVLVTLCAIAFDQRCTYYSSSKEAMEQSAEALRSDSDLNQVIATLKKAPPGRVYAGTRGNWGSWLRVGGIHLYDLLPTEQFATVMPWQTLSLNSPYLWDLSTPDAKLCRLFNIRYIVAPPTLTVPSFYRPLVTTSSLILYEVDSGGYLQLGQILQTLPAVSPFRFYFGNRKWIRSEEPSQGEFIAHDPKSEESEAAAKPNSSSESTAAPGFIEHEVVKPDSFSAEVTANSPALLVLKVTYHPNWHVMVDGREQHSFMVSPSYIGTRITPGRHEVEAEYRSSTLKKLLMLLAAVTLIATIMISAFDLVPNRLSHFFRAD
jgi:hypothetical protein